MRPLALAALLCLASGCATAEQQRRFDERRGVVQPTPAEVARTARADSLLALPPDSLTEADARWLTVYYAEREAANDRRGTEAAERQARSIDTYVALAALGAAVVVGVFLYSTVIP